MLATTVLAGLGSFGASYGVAWKIGSIALSTALNIGLFWVGLRLLTARDVSWRSLRGGAIAAGIGYEILQAVGGFYVGHVLTSSSDTYGTFALVIGLLSFVYLAAHVTLLAAEGERRRGTRIVAEEPVGDRRCTTTEADRRALTALTRAEKRRTGQTIEVEFAGKRRARAGAAVVTTQSERRTQVVRRHLGGGADGRRLRRDLEAEGARRAALPQLHARVGDASGRRAACRSTASRARPGCCCTTR